MDLRDLRRDLEALPQEPVPEHHPRNWWARAKRGADFVGHARPDVVGFFRRVNPYPRPWQHRWLKTEDGVDIAAWYGPVEPGGPSPAGGAQSRQKDPPFGLVIVPGMFSGKDDSIHKRRALWIWRAWGIPVVIIDMRAFGESKGIGTGGWKESFDVLAAAQLLVEEAGVERVGVLAESMGGAATINALAHDARSHTDWLHGGALMFSAFVDVGDAVRYISAEPTRGDPFRTQWAGFRKMLRFRSGGAYDNFHDYMDDAARVNGLSGFEELVEIANPKWKISMVHQPALLVHAVDDPVVPIRHARRVERYARDQPNVQVLTTSWGTHTHFEAMEPDWFWEVVRRFYSKANGIDLPPVR